MYRKRVLLTAPGRDGGFGHVLTVYQGRVPDSAEIPRLPNRRDRTNVG